MTRHFLGIDVGLSGTRAAIIDAAGRLCGTGKCENATTPGPAEQWPDLWVEQIFKAARAAVSSAGVDALDAIAVGALGPAPVVLDQNHAALFPAPLFGLDPRSEPQRLRLQLEHGLSDAELGPDHALPKLAWLREAWPETFSRASLCVDATGFIVGRLTGRWTMDTITRDYFIAGNTAAAVPLPVPYRPLEIAGPLSASAASALGLRSGTPVAVGSIDSYVDIWATGAERSGDSCLLAGTTLILGRILREPIASAGLRCTGSIGGGVFFGGWTSCFGAAIDWAAGLDSECTSMRESPAAILMLPYLAGERAPVWDSCASGLMLGLLRHSTLQDMREAARDAIVLSALDIAMHLEAATGPVEVYHATGGLLQSSSFGQALANGLGTAIEVAECGEARAAARLAAAATGHAVPRQIRMVIRPEPQRREAYLSRLAIYRDLYRATAPLMKRFGDLIAGEQKCQRA